MTDLYAVLGGVDCSDYTYLDSIWDDKEKAMRRVDEINDAARPGACEDGGLMVLRLNDATSLPEWVIEP